MSRDTSARGRASIAPKAAAPQGRTEARIERSIGEPRWRPSAKIGISCLAVGADQLFAARVVGLAGTLEVILPFEHYEQTLDVSEREGFARLLGAAARVVVLGGERDSEEAYFAAGRRVVEESDAIIAVWNHLPAEGKGGTGDVVACARSLHRPITCIDPFARTVTEI